MILPRTSGNHSAIVSRGLRFVFNITDFYSLHSQIIHHVQLETCLLQLLHNAREGVITIKASQNHSNPGRTNTINMEAMIFVILRGMMPHKGRYKSDEQLLLRLGDKHTTYVKMFRVRCGYWRDVKCVL